MYQELMLDVHRQWLEEFDHEQAIRRLVPRQRRYRGVSGPAALLQLVRRRREERQPALAGRLPQAPQCT